MSDYHWTIEIKFLLAKEKKRSLTPDDYKVWWKELKARIPNREGRKIYHRSEALAKRAFQKAGLSEDEFEICKGFWLL